MTQALLFDFNGVIANDEEQHRQAMGVVLAGVGIALTHRDYYARYLGFDDRTAFVEAFQHANRTLTTELLDHLVAAKAAAYADLVAATVSLVPGVVEFVTKAAGRFRLGVVSGSPHREIDPLLDRAGLRDKFETIVAGDDVSTGKPDPAGYLAACAALAARKPLSPRDCLVFEDSLPGLEAARAAGMRCIALTTNLNARLFPAAAAVWLSFDGHDPAELA